MIFAGRPLPAEEAAGEQIYDVAASALAGSIQDWHGSKVRVTGFVRLGVGGDSIYDDEESALNPKKGVWLEIADDEVKKYRMNYDGSFCIVEGTVNKENHGHLGGWAGAIEKITRFEYERASEKSIQV